MEAWYLSNVVPRIFHDYGGAPLCSQYLSNPRPGQPTDANCPGGLCGDADVLNHQATGLQHHGLRFLRGDLGALFLPWLD